MSKLDELIRELCPNGVKYKRFDEVCTLNARIGWQRLTKAEYKSTGDYLLITGTDFTDLHEINYQSCVYVSEERYGQDPKIQLKNGDILITKDGTLGKVAQANGLKMPATLNGGVFVVRCKDGSLINRFILHYLLSNHFQNVVEQQKTGSTISHLTQALFSRLMIPLPPLEIQREIVRILDNFTNLTAELTARKTQYAYYRDKLLKAETNAHKYKLGEIATVTKLAGFEFTNYVTYSENGNIIALRGLNVKNGRLDLHDVKYVDKSDFSKLERSKLHIGDMLFTYVGTIGQVAIVDEEDKYYLAPNVALIRCDKEALLPQYMKYYFQTTRFWDKQIRRLLQSSSMQNIPMEKIRKFEIAVPPLDVQNRIVNVLDNFEKICSDLNIGLPAEIEARQKQYEYYRDKLLTFKEVAAT